MFWHWLKETVEMFILLKKMVDKNIDGYSSTYAFASLILLKCMLGNFSSFCCCLLTIFKMFFEKFFQEC